VRLKERYVDLKTAYFKTKEAAKAYAEAAIKKLNDTYEGK